MVSVGSFPGPVCVDVGDATAATAQYDVCQAIVYLDLHGVQGRGTRDDGSCRAARPRKVQVMITHGQRVVLDGDISGSQWQQPPNDTRTEEKRCHAQQHPHYRCCGDSTHTKMRTHAYA
jgi:hypothetical protein